MAEGKLSEVFGKLRRGELASITLPKATPAVDKNVSAHLGEVLPDNFSFFPEVVKSLRSKGFLIFFLGQIVALSGMWIQQVAMSWLVLRLSPPNSFFEPALVLFLANIPTLFITPISGAFCDIFDRRKILICTQSLMMLQTFILAYLTISGLITINILYVLSFLFGVFVSFDAPARQSFYSRLVPSDDLSNAIALNSIAFNGTRLIGPAVGGFLISFIGEGWGFFINGVAFFGVIFALSIIKPMKSNFVQESFKNPVLKIKEGLLYTLNSVPLRSILMLLVSFSFLGVPFVMMFHTFVKDVLKEDSSTLGVLMSCIGVGAMISAVYLAARKSVLGLGKIVMFSCIIFGVAEFCMAFVDNAVLAGFVCVPMGFAMICVAVSCNTLLQTIVDDEKRGRIMSLFTMAIFGMPPIGTFLFGIVSDKIGIQNVMIICAILCILLGLIFLKYRPIIRRHTRKIYIEKGIISEIAVGLDSVNKA